MSLQFALILLGLVALVLVLLFSYAQGWVRLEARFGRLLEHIQFPDRFTGWFRSETASKTVHREPSLVPASEFRFDPVPDDSVGISSPEGDGKSEGESRPRGVVMEADDEMHWPLKIDYWARIPGTVPVTRNEILSVYRRYQPELEHPSRIHGRNYPSNIWSDLDGGSGADRYTDLVVSIQLVDHYGPVTESEMTRANGLIFELAEELNRRFQLDMTVEEALAQAERLDRFCRYYDVLVIINLAARGEAVFSGEDILRVMERSRMQIDEMGMFHFSDSRTGRSRFTMANRYEPGSFAVDSLDKFSTRGLTMFMNVPRVSDPGEVFGEFVSVAEYVASELSGELQDPDGNPIDRSGFEQIQEQIAKLSETLGRAGIIPGSEEALRLF